jgi:hypothetical protein
VVAKPRYVGVRFVSCEMGMTVRKAAKIGAIISACTSGILALVSWAVYLPLGLALFVLFPIPFLAAALVEVGVLGVRASPPHNTQLVPIAIAAMVLFCSAQGALYAVVIRWIRAKRSLDSYATGGLIALPHLVAAAILLLR